MQRVCGLLLFLPVPLVLFLFTRQPLGAFPSLGLGVALVLTHRLYARPWALARASSRCLWCGAGDASGEPLVLDEPLGRTEWRACAVAHRERLVRTLGWATVHRRFLAVGILGTLALFLGLAAAAAVGVASPRLHPADGVALFRLGVAVTVLPFGWLAPTWGQAAAASRRLPFPVHIQALVGTVWVLWLFRLVGLWWLAAGLVHVVRRLSG